MMGMVVIVVGTGGTLIGGIIGVEGMVGEEMMWMTQLECSFYI